MRILKAATFFALPALPALPFVFALFVGGNCQTSFAQDGDILGSVMDQIDELPFSHGAAPGIPASQSVEGYPLNSEWLPAGEIPLQHHGAQIPQQEILVAGSPQIEYPGCAIEGRPVTNGHALGAAEVMYGANAGAPSFGVITHGPNYNGPKYELLKKRCGRKGGCKRGCKCGFANKLKQRQKPIRLKRVRKASSCNSIQCAENSNPLEQANKAQLARKPAPGYPLFDSYPQSTPPTVPREARETSATTYRR